ncbi:MAG: beta-propeller domain-containing protein [Thiolinea sp.]
MNFPPRLLTCGCLTAVLLTGCGSDSDTDVFGSTTTPAVSSRLQQANATDLLSTIRKALLAQYGTVRDDLVYPVMAEDAAGASDGAVSTTNVQEAGVDEADRLKTDGQYLYAAALERPALRVLRADAAATPVTELRLSEEPVGNLNGLYLDNQRITALASPFVYGIAPMMADSFLPYPPGNSSSQVHLVDVSNPASPRRTSLLELDGEIISSRMINGRLYLATRYTPTLDGLVFPTTEEQAAANRSLINAATLNDFLPDYALNGVPQGELFEAGDCFTTRYSEEDDSLNLVSLVAVDTRAATPQPEGQCYVGNAETLYASPHSLYLATTRYRYSTDANGLAVYNGEVDTDLHHFTLDNGVSYRGSGRVDGHLGWYQDLKPFRLSEHGDTLRVITQSGASADSDSPAQLYTLQTDAASGDAGGRAVAECCSPRATGQAGRTNLCHPFCRRACVSGHVPPH